MFPILGIEVLLDFADVRCAFAPDRDLREVVIQHGEADAFRETGKVQPLQFINPDRFPFAVPKLGPLVIWAVVTGLVVVLGRHVPAFKLHSFAERLDRFTLLFGGKPRSHT